MPKKILPDKTVEMLWRGGYGPKEISDVLREDFNIAVTPEAISMWRLRKGYEPRLVRHKTLLPWRVKVEHMQLYVPKMLRAEARRRLGLPNTDEISRELERWKANLRDTGMVVTYDRETGWDFVPGRDGEDLIRVPDKA